MATKHCKQKQALFSTKSLHIHVGWISPGAVADASGGGRRRGATKTRSLAEKTVGELGAPQGCSRRSDVSRLQVVEIALCKRQLTLRATAAVVADKIAAAAAAPTSLSPTSRKTHEQQSVSALIGSLVWAGTRGGRRRPLTAELRGRPSCSNRENLQRETRTSKPQTGSLVNFKNEKKEKEKKEKKERKTI